MMYAYSRTSRKPLSPYAPAFAVGSENSPMQTCYTPQKGITGGLAMAERDAGVPNGAARSITSRLQVLETKVLVPHTNVICRYARVMRHLRSVRLIQRAFRATLKRREESNARAFYELLQLPPFLQGLLKTIDQIISVLSQVPSVINMEGAAGGISLLSLFWQAMMADLLHMKNQIAEIIKVHHDLYLA